MSLPPLSLTRSLLLLLFLNPTRSVLGTSLGALTVRVPSLASDDVMLSGLDCHSVMS